jgi:hypothetical protein
MGYVPPYIPVQSIQYHNRINFNSWRSVSPVERTMKVRWDEAAREAFREPISSEIDGKGKIVDRFI